MTFLAKALRRLKMSLSMDRLVRHMRLNACFLFFTASAHSVFHQGTLILWEFLDCGIDATAASRMQSSNVVSRRLTDQLTYPKIYCHKEDESSSSLPWRGAIEAGSSPKQDEHGLYVCL